MILSGILAIGVLGISFLSFRFWDSGVNPFVEDDFVGNRHIEIYNLKPNQVVSSPITLEGKTKR